MASYNPPNPYVPGAFNPSQFITPSDNITTKFLDENYLRFPFAQGVENFVSINNQGSLNQGGLADFTSTTTPAIFNLPPTITNPILDTATTPLNAVATIGYVLANEQGGGDLLPLNNLWTGVNNFNPPVQTYGSTMTQGLTLTNNQFNYSGSGLSTQLVSYTPASSNGFSIFSISATNTTTGNAPQLQVLPDGALTILSAEATNGIIRLNATGNNGLVQINSNTGINIGTSSVYLPKIFSTIANQNMELACSGTNSGLVLNTTAGVLLQTNPTISFGSYGTLTGGTSGLSTTSDFTAKTITVNDGVDNTYQIFSQNTPSYGFVIANTTGNLGTLTLSNNSSTLSTLTATTNGLSISTSVILPAQTTYTPSTTYGNVGATQQFVQQALASQGGGDASLGGNNDFTGINNFNNNINGGTTSNIGLTIVGNNQIGSAEADIICINQTSNVGLNIYAESTPVTTTTVPKIQILNDGNATVFNTDITLPTQSQYNPGTTYTNTSATQAFVQSAVSGIFTATLSIPISSFGGSQSGFPTPTGATFTQTYNSKTQTNTLYLTPFVFTAASSVIQFTLTFPTELYPTGSTPSFLAGSGLTYYNASFGQTFPLQTSFLSSTQIRCSTSPTASIGGTSQISGQILIGWT
jgi:hypothetical protein